MVIIPRRFLKPGSASNETDTTDPYVRFGAYYVASFTQSNLPQQPPPEAALFPPLHVPPIVHIVGGGGGPQGPVGGAHLPFVTIWPQVTGDSLQGCPACFKQVDNCAANKLQKLHVVLGLHVEH